MSHPSIISPLREILTMGNGPRICIKSTQRWKALTMLDVDALRPGTRYNVCLHVDASYSPFGYFRHIPTMTHCGLVITAFSPSTPLCLILLFSVILCCVVTKHVVLYTGQYKTGTHFRLSQLRFLPEPGASILSTTWCRKFKISLSWLHLSSHSLSFSPLLWLLLVQ
jgi:hypothetical protein